MATLFTKGGMPMTALKNDRSRSTLLIIGPLPPPYGGVANFILNIERQAKIRSSYDVKLYRTGKMREGISDLFQVVVDGFQFMRFMVRRECKDVDMVHLHTSAYWSLLRNMPYVFLIKRTSGARLIIHMHDGTFERFYRASPPFLQRMVRWMFRAGDMVIVTSPSWVKLMSEVCGEGAKIEALPNGFDPGTFHPSSMEEARASLGLPRDKKILLAIGYLEKVKGFEHLVRAMGDVLKERDDVVLYIIGTGSLRGYLASLVAELGIENNVSFIENRKTSEEIARWMVGSDVFVISSLNEGNPTVMFECLGCGRPLVATRVGGIPDVITSDGLGLLCDPADSLGLAKCIKAALDSTWDEGYISEYAQRFTWGSIASDLVEKYRRA